MFRAFKVEINEKQPINELIKATLEQNKLLMQILNKDNTAVVSFSEVYQPIKKRLDEDKYSSYKQRRRRR